MIHSFYQLYHSPQEGSLHLREKERNENKEATTTNVQNEQKQYHMTLSYHLRKVNIQKISVCVYVVDDHEKRKKEMFRGRASNETDND